MALDPLKFQVAIQDDATGQLNKIEQEFEKLKDKTINVKVDGVDDLQRLLQMLGQQQSPKIGEKVSEDAGKATAALQQLQKLAQSAIKGSFEKFVEDLSAVKQAIQHDNFTAFSKRIEECTGSIEKLTKAFSEFRTVIEGNKELTEILKGWGAAVKEVSAALMSINAVKGSHAASPQTEELKQTEQGLVKVASALGAVRDAMSSSARGGVSGVPFLESITRVGEGNIQTLIKEQGHIERLIALAEKSIKFGEGHDVAGMQGLRVQMRGNLESLIGYRDVIKDILYQAQNGNQSIIHFLNTLGALRTTPLGKDLSGNDITLFGGHFDQLTHSVTGTSHAMRQLNREMQLDNAAIEKTRKEQAQAAKQTQKDNEAWTESVRKAGIEATKLEIKIRKLKEVEAKGSAVGIDTTKLRNEIDMLESCLVIFQKIANGSRLFGHASASINNASYENASIRAKDEAQAVARSTSEIERNNTAKQKAAGASSQLTAEEQRLAQALGQSTESARGQSQVLSDLKSMATQYLGVWGGQQFLQNIIEIGGQLEMQRLSIGAILQNTEQANDLFDKIKGMAVKSPFGVVELDQMTKQLTAYGFKYDELFDMTKRLADISAATGTGVDRLALALGHVRSEAALSGYTLRQFSMGNVPLLQKLSEKLGKSTKEIREMVRKKEIGYGDVIGVLKDLTNEGGMFYNMQEVISESVKAKFKNVKDAMDIMYGEIAEGSTGDALKEVAKLLMDLTRNWKDVAAVMGTVAAVWAIQRSAILLMNAALGSNTQATLANIQAVMKRENANYRLMVASHALSEAEARHLMYSGKYSSSLLSVSLKTQKLTVAELQRAVALGKLDKQIAITAVEQAGLDATIIRSTKVLGFWRKALFLAGEGFGALKASVVSFLASVWPLLAITAVFESVFHAIRQNSEAEEAGSDAAEKLKTKYDELADLNERLGSSEGKSSAELKEGVAQMQKALDKAGLLTPELRKQVTETDQLAGKYNLLRESLQGAAADFDELRSKLAVGLAEALNAGGGTAWNPVNWFRDNMNEDIANYQKSRIEFESQLNGTDVRNDLERFMRGKRIWSVGYAGLKGAQLFSKLTDEQRRQWAGSSSWFSRNIGWGNSDVQNARKAYLDYLSDEGEISGSQGKEFARRLRDRVLNHLVDVDWDHLGDDDRIEIDKQIRRALNSIPEADAVTKEKLRSIVVDELLGGKVPEYVREVLNEESVSDDDDGGAGSGEDVNAKVLRARVRILKEAADSYKYWREKVGDEGAMSHVGAEYGQLLSEQGFSFDNVEQLRETLQRLRDEYGKKPQSKDLLAALTELDKELAGLGRHDFEHFSKDFLSKTQVELDRLTRAWDDFNKVLEATGDIDLARNLSGAGYNQRSHILSIADAVRRQSEEDYTAAGGQKNGLSFNHYLSDREIEDEVRAGAPRTAGETTSAYETRIQGLVESYKKWRDLQRDVLRHDLQVFAQIAGSAQDYESQFKRIDGQLDHQIESLDRLKSAGVITEEEYGRVVAAVRQPAESGKFQLSAQYLNLMNHAAAMVTEELEAAATAAENDLQKSLQTNVISSKDFAEQMEKIHLLVRDIRLNSFFGKGEFGAFLSGGLVGAVSWLDTAISKRIIDLGNDYTTDKDGNYTGDDKELQRLLGHRETWEKVQMSLSGVSSVSQVVTGAFEGLQSAASDLSDMFDALGNEGAANFWSDVSSVIGGISGVLSPVDDILRNAMSGNVSGIVSSAVSAPVSLFTNPIKSFAQLHDKRLERAIERLRADVRDIEANTAQILKSRERTLGYDTGDVRRFYATQYSSNDKTATIYNWRTQASTTVEFQSAAQKAMYEYYTRNSSGNGYQQQLANLKAEREGYIEMYNAESEKKKASESALAEYKSKIAELDDQIRYFAEDIANELWSIDIKGWADQFSDAFMTAFENGESLLKAFEDTAKSVMQSVVSEMLKIGIIEPMMDRLRTKMFGYTDSSGAFHQGAVSTEELVADPTGSAEKMLSVIGDYFKPGGEGSNMAAAAQEYLSGIDHLLHQLGYANGLRNESTSTLSSSVQGTSEETSGLLAGYVNALRQDVSVNRILLTQFVAELWPEYVAAYSNHVRTVANIDANVRLVMEMMRDGDGAFFREVSAMRSRLDHVVDGIESLSVR